MLQRIIQRFRDYRIARRKNISARLANGSFSLGKGSTVPLLNLDFEGNGSIHIGGDNRIRGNFATRLPGASIRVGNRCFIAAGTMVVAAERVEIGDDVLIGEGCYISDNDGHSLDIEIRSKDLTNRRKGVKSWDGIGIAPVVIESNAWIAPRCIVLKGVTIGRGAVIGAGSVVTKDVPAMCLAAGNPARVVRKI
jgi:galactoside O-acetyltransferase